MKYTRAISIMLVLLVCAQFAQAQSSSENISSNYGYLLKKGNAYSHTHLMEIKQSSGKLQLIKSQGLEVMQRLSRDLFIVRPFPHKTASFRWSALPSTLRDLGEVNNRWKMPATWNGTPPKGRSTYFLSTSNPAAMRAKISSLGKRVSIIDSKPEHSLLKISADGQGILSIIDEPSLRSITQESQSPQVESKVLDMNINPNKINTLQNLYPQYTGKNIRVSVQEFKYDVDDLDLLGKDLPSDLSAGEVDQHATEMATVIAGHGNSSLYGRGVAVDAGLTSSDFSDVLPDPSESYIQLGVQVQNHSYGTTIENFYGALAEAYDQSANDNPSLLHVFSAGNIGNQTSEEGPYAGIPNYANLTGNFKMSKNSLIVSAVDTTGTVLERPSRGPAYDGRIKPELVAYSIFGSSNSAALVSGVAGLLQEAYQSANSGTPAPAALIKAILINTAEDVGRTGPDFETGFGNMNALQAMRAVEAKRYFSGRISAGQNTQFPLEVSENAVSIKATLVWTDPAAAPNAGIALINDLDFSIEDPQQNRQLPWVLDPAADEAALSSVASRGEDHLNNIEQISIDRPEAGVYTLKVNGNDIPEGPQDFYIAYEIKYAGAFEWTYPTATDFAPFNGETTGYLRWQHTLEGRGDLSYRIIGEPWQTIYVNRPMDRNPTYRWDVPDTTAWAQVKMTVEGVEYLSDVFRISKPPRLRVGFNCADSLRLKWNKQEWADDYEVSTLINGKLTPIAIVEDTFLVIRKSDFDNSYFSIAGRKEEWPWMYSGSADYNQQGGACFLQSFFALNNNDESVELTANLSDILGVESIVFEREEGGSFIPLGELPINGNFTLLFTDDAPKNGENIYRARVLLNGGGQILSDPYTEFVLVDDDYEVFPNPVERGRFLSVFSRGEERAPTRISFYDSSGRIAWGGPIFSSRGFVEIPESMRQGLYYYELEQDGNPIKRGKIFIQ